MSSSKHLTKGSSEPVLGNDGVLRLFSMRFCPYSQRVHLVLDAKKIPYHTIFVNLHDKPEWLTKFSPLGKVPALHFSSDKGDTVLTESMIICEYLDEKYPEYALYPKDPLRKAQDKLLIEQFSGVITIMYKLFVNTEITPGSVTELSTALDAYEKELIARGTSFFAGDNPGMVDFMIWPWCERSDMLTYLLGSKYEIKKTRFKHLFKWRDLMLENVAVKSSYLDGETHAKFMKTRREGNPDYDMLI